MSTAIVACGAIATHISNIASRENFDLTIYPLPPLLHNHPEKIAGEVDAKIKEIKDKHSKIAVAYSDCGTYGALDEVIKKYDIQRLGGDHCYDVFAGKQKAPKNPMPVMIACIARVGSPNLAGTSRRGPIVTIAAADAPTSARVRGPTDVPARARSQPIAEPSKAAIPALITTNSCCEISTEPNSIIGGVYAGLSCFPRVEYGNSENIYWE